MSGNKKDIAFFIDDKGCFICTSHFLHFNPKCPKHVYPQISHNGKPTRMHRYIYESCIGKIPRGMCVLHKCDNTLCINPLHLKIGTVADNNIDMRQKGRSASGVKNGMSKLTESEVLNILKDATTPHSEIAAKYGVTASTVERIRYGETWKHLGVTPAWMKK